MDRWWFSYPLNIWMNMMITLDLMYELINGFINGEWIHLWWIDVIDMYELINGFIESHWCRMYIIWMLPDMYFFIICKSLGSMVPGFSGFWHLSPRRSSQIQIRVSFCWWWSHHAAAQLEVSRGCQKHSEGVPSAKDFATRKVWQWHLLARTFFSLSLRTN